MCTSNLIYNYLSPFVSSMLDTSENWKSDFVYVNVEI